MFPEFSTLSEFLAWLASSAGSLFVSGFFVAYVLERFSVWHNLAHDLKAVVTLALAGVVSYVAKEYLNVPLVINNEALNQFFALAIYYFSNQLAYKRYFKV